MRRSLAVHVAANWAALTTTLIFGFFLTPFMLHRLRDAAFGLWVLMASLGTNVLNAMLAIGIIFIPGFARLARASTLSALQQQYVEAARSIGMSHSRIIMRELLPNVVTPLLVEAAVAFAYAVLLESALSFLGLGAQPPEPSWGSMLNSAQRFLSLAPWLAVFPGLAIFLCVLSFNLVGDGLRDALDPRGRR